MFPSILKKLKEEGFTGRVRITAVVGYLDSPVPAGLDPVIRVKVAKKINSEFFYYCVFFFFSLQHFNRELCFFFL